MTVGIPDREAVEALLAFSTPSVLNGLKRLGKHPSELESLDRNVVRCISPGLGRRVGFAATRKVWTGRDNPESSGLTALDIPGAHDDHILAVPGPRILVAENVGDWRGRVCIWGEVAANLYKALDCTAGITNGPVRDIDEMQEVGFQTYAGGVDVGGGFVKVLETGQPVEIGGVAVATGDLLHGDGHGVVKVPLELVEALPDAIRGHEAKERNVIDLCRSSAFSLPGYAAAWTARSY
ncbi:RraA family protein [Frankia sp. R43]|uniref:RraA family protein n=2 Tax=unclassified Frankia TaxID=2632575 RepID=UPI0006CA5B65|nr:RraA family protein [Frankia sp. R43]